MEAVSLNKDLKGKKWILCFLTFFGGFFKYWLLGFFMLTSILISWIIALGADLNKPFSFWRRKMFNVFGYSVVKCMVLSCIVS